MQLTTLFLGLAAAATSVSAIDIGLRSQGGCGSGGGGFLCTGWNPNSCCGIPSGTVASIYFYFIPRDWFLELRGHEGGGCRALKTVDTIFGGTDKCLNSGPYTGAGYSFRSRKREGEQVHEGACESAEATGSCTETVMADVLYLGDQTKYNIVNMDQALIEELAGLMNNGSVVADIPAVFKPFEIAA